MITYEKTLAARLLGGGVRADYMEALIKKELEVTETDYLIIGTNRRAPLKSAPLPIIIHKDDSRNTTDKTIALCDLTRIKSDEADFRMTHTAAVALWEDPVAAERFLPLREFGARVYARWVAKSLESSMRFDWEDVAKLQILFAIYYHCAHSTPREVYERSYSKLLDDLAKITGLPVAKIKACWEEWGLSDWEGSLTLIDCIELATTISLDTKQKINLQSLQAAVSRGWMGSAGPTYCMTALQYPPTLLSLTYYALVSRGYSRTQLGTLIKDYAVGRNGERGSRFVDIFHRIVKTAFQNKA